MGIELVIDFVHPLRSLPTDCKTLTFPIVTVTHVEEGIFTYTGHTEAVEDCVNIIDTKTKEVLTQGKISIISIGIDRPIEDYHLL